MERRDFLALAASVPLLAPPAGADDDTEPAPAETDIEETAGDGTDTIKIDVRFN